MERKHDIMKRLLIIFLFVLITFTSTAKEKIIPYEINNKIGFLNENLEVIHEPEFYKLGACFDKQCYVYNRDTSNKLHYFIVTSDKIIKVPDNVFDVRILGDDYYVFNYDSSFNKPYLNYYDDHVTAVIHSNESEEEYLFHNLEFYSSKDVDFIRIDDIKHKPRHNYINLKGEKFFSEDFNLNTRSFNKKLDRGVMAKDTSHYIIDSSLNIISNKEFSFFYDFSDDGLILGVTKDERGFFDINGNLIIPISRIPEIDMNYVCNRLPVVINNQGKYDLYSAELCESENWAILDKTGAIIKKNIQASEITRFSEDGTAILKKQDGTKEYHYYLINSDGELLCTDYFDRISNSVNGYCRAKKDGIDYLISSKDGTVYKCEDFK